MPNGRRYKCDRSVQCDVSKTISIATWNSINKIIRDVSRAIASIVFQLEFEAINATNIIGLLIILPCTSVFNSSIEKRQPRIRAGGETGCCTPDSANHRNLASRANTCVHTVRYFPEKPKCATAPETSRLAPQTSYKIK